MNLGRVLSRYPGKDCRRIDLLIGEKNLWGQGYGTDTINALTRFGFEEEGADMIFGLVYDYNPRSLRAFGKAGYVVDQRIEEPSGRKAKWSFDLVLRKQDYARENPRACPAGVLPHVCVKVRQRGVEIL
jgi:RimJ/RimL family protein N-acetyltransferase